MVLESLLRSTEFEPVSLLVLRNREAGITHLLQAVPSAVPIYIVEKSVMDAIAGFPVHRGVLALARRCETAPALRVGDRSVLGIGLANHDNVGGIVRCCAAFGASALFDETSADPLYRKAIRVSAGAAFTLPHRRSGSADALIGWLEREGVVPLALSPSGATDLRDVDPGRRLALVVGTEGAGLPREIMRRCETARITMAPGHDSLNVTVATGIALHALARR